MKSADLKNLSRNLVVSRSPKVCAVHVVAGTNSRITIGVDSYIVGFSISFRKRLDGSWAWACLASKHDARKDTDASLKSIENYN